MGVEFWSTVVQAISAGVVAFFTIRLWVVARDQHKTLDDTLTETRKAAEAAKASADVAVIQAEILRAAHKQHLSLKNLRATCKLLKAPSHYELVVECDITNTSQMNVILERVDTFQFGSQGGFGFTSAGGRTLIPGESFPMTRPYGVTADELGRIHRYFIGVIRFIDAFGEPQNQSFGWACIESGSTYIFDPAYGRIIDETIRRGEEDLKARQKKDKAEGRVTGASVLPDLE